MHFSVLFALLKENDAQNFDSKATKNESYGWEIFRRENEVGIIVDI